MFIDIIRIIYISSALFFGITSIVPQHLLAQAVTSDLDTDVSRSGSNQIVEIEFIGLDQQDPKVGKKQYTDILILKKDIEPELPVQVGSAWTSSQIGPITRVVDAFLKRRGYFFSKVQVLPMKVAGGYQLSIKLILGEPTTITQIEFDDPSVFSTQRDRLRFRDRIEEILQLSDGNRYDEQYFANRLRVLREWLVSENFIQANTDEVSLRFSENHLQVAIRLNIIFGDRVSFGYLGNEQFVKAELTELITEMRTAGLGKDYISAIIARFKDEYAKLAYNHVEITTTTTERRNTKHVMFTFKEGVRSELIDVVLDGLTDENESLARTLFEEAASRHIQRGYYVDADIDLAATAVVNDLRARGYLSSRLLAKNAYELPPESRAHKNRHRYRVLLQFSEGEQTAVSSVDLAGFERLSKDDALLILGLRSADPFNPFKFEEGLAKLKQRYVDDGYLDFTIMTPEQDMLGYSERNVEVSVKLLVHEGRQYKIGQVEIDGLSFTKRFVVDREIVLKTDEPWVATKLQDQELRLKSLGLFSDVRIKPRASKLGPDYKDAVIEFIEVQPGSFEIGPGFRSDLGIRAASKLSYNNIFGRGWAGVLTLEGNRRVDDQYRFPEFRLDANVIEPRLFGTNFLFNIGLSARKQRFPPDFNAVRTEVYTGLERRLNRILTSKLYYRLERIRQFDVYVDNRLSERDNRSLLIGSLSPGLTLDTRDSPFTTTRGWLANLSLEYAHPTLAGNPVTDETSPAYQKWTASIKRYTPLTDRIIWSNVVSGGFARSQLAERDIPIIKLFR